MSTSNLDQNYVEEIRRYAMRLNSDMERLGVICSSLANSYDCVSGALNDERLERYFTEEFQHFIREVKKQKEVAENELIPWLKRHADELEELLSRKHDRRWIL